MFVKGHCSPSKDNNKTVSCLNYEILKKIAETLNNFDYGIRVYKGKKALHNEISKKIRNETSCKTEACWKSLRIIKDELSDHDKEVFEDSFRPDMPKEWKDKPNTWLSTIDINKVMEQYEDAYPKFQYLGANPIDFDKKITENKCVSNELCNIDIKSIKKDGKDFLGMVFNTDPHNQSGEHWFSLYIDLKGVNIKDEPYIYYFDSLALKPKEEVVDFVKRVQEQCLNINKDIQFLYNDIKHQHKNTECGVYCLHFLVSMLKGEDFKNYINHERNDKEMEKFREFFFVSE
tara:strand:+ start:1987 stop:2853 length:867 start_codon:yes stop_codon:yes gene_type:complete